MESFAKGERRLGRCCRAADESERQDFFARSVEVEGAVLLIGSHGEQAGLGRAMAVPDVAIREFAGAAAIEKVAHVLDRWLAWSLHHFRRRFAAVGPPFVLLAIDEERPAFAVELDPVGWAAGNG